MGGGDGGRVGMGGEERHVVEGSRSVGSRSDDDGRGGEAKGKGGETSLPFLLHDPRGIFAQCRESTLTERVLAFP